MATATITYGENELFYSRVFSGFVLLAIIVVLILWANDKQAREE
jgi:hypothetical protein